MVRSRRCEETAFSAAARLTRPAAAGGQVARVLQLAVHLLCDAAFAKITADTVAARRALRTKGCIRVHFHVHCALLVAVVEAALCVGNRSDSGGSGPGNGTGILGCCERDAASCAAKYGRTKRCSKSSHGASSRCQTPNRAGNSTRIDLRAEPSNVLTAAHMQDARRQSTMWTSARNASSHYAYRRSNHRSSCTAPRPSPSYPSDHSKRSPAAAGSSLFINSLWSSSCVRTPAGKAHTTAYLVISCALPSVESEVLYEYACMYVCERMCVRCFISSACESLKRRAMTDEWRGEESGGR